MDKGGIPPLVPAMGMGMAPAAYQPMAVNKVVSSKGWFVAKLVLGSFIIVFDVILIGVSAGIYAQFYWSDDALIDFLLGFCCAIVSLCWQIAEFITVCVHRDHRGIHPGAHVGLHLINWLDFVISMAFLALFVSYHQCGGYSYYSSSSYSSYSSCYRRYYLRSGDYGVFQSLELSILAFLVLLTILHFILFVRFCIECNRRNQMRSALYVIQAPAMPGQSMYYGGAQPYMMPQPVMLQPPPAHLSQAHTSMYAGGFTQQQPLPQQQMQMPGGTPEISTREAVPSPGPVSEVSADALPRHPDAQQHTPQGGGVP